MFVCVHAGGCACTRCCCFRLRGCMHLCVCSIKILVNNYESWGMIKMSKEKASISIYRV